VAQVIRVSERRSLAFGTDLFFMICMKCLCILQVWDSPGKNKVDMPEPTMPSLLETLAVVCWCVASGDIVMCACAQVLLYQGTCSGSFTLRRGCFLAALICQILAFNVPEGFWERRPVICHY
jgi:hypothetical protein